MNLLAIETATPACSVALYSSNQIFERHEIAPRRHSHLVLTFVNDVLSEANIGLSDLEGIVCGVGPGSFMGVRLAVSVVQGLAFSLEIPVLALSTLHVVAQTAYEICAVDQYVVAWDARMKEVYYGGYRLGGSGVMVSEHKDRLVKPYEIDLPQEEMIYVAGNAWEEYSNEIPAPVMNSVNVVRGVYPRASAMLTLAKSMSYNDQFASVEALKPTYLRSAV